MKVSRNFLKRKKAINVENEDRWELTDEGFDLLKDIADVDAFELDVWETTDELATLLLRKHHDYGPKNISQSPGGPLNGLRVRMWDKVARINNLIDSGNTPENESLEDSFKDLANYSIIALMVLRGKWPQE